jgi:hypothetical protein
MVMATFSSFRSLNHFFRLGLTIFLLALRHSPIPSVLQRLRSIPPLSAAGDVLVLTRFTSPTPAYYEQSQGKRVFRATCVFLQAS